MKMSKTNRKDMNGVVVIDRGTYYHVSRTDINKDDLGNSFPKRGTCRVPRDATARHAFDVENREFFSARLTKHLNAIQRQENTPTRFQLRKTLAFLRRGLKNRLLAKGKRKISLHDLKIELLSNREELVEELSGMAKEMVVKNS